jgi:hypothetical protein
MGVKIQTFAIWVLVFSFAGFAGAQSLAELAKKEKERRNKNKAKGSEAQVITEHDLSRAKSPMFTSTAVPSTATARPTSRGSEGSESSESAGAEGGNEGGASEEVAAPTAIPTDAPLQQKIALFEQMVKAYRAEVEKIDQEIAKNNDRIQEIDGKLATIGSGGLPVVPAANQIANNTYDPGEAIALQNEQQQLREKNQQLEVQKTSKANDLRQKGRRAGIPASYLRF